ncbi:MAG: heavy-metal-associated domain-containing protein [Candidatus Schekmanbacteria bacterium]|nr:heavy-metal-associated domain-containing protein [Candidatus Schekmanbacteria bacterium]
MAEAKLTVDGMSCQMCVKHVKKAIEEFKSARNVNVDLDKKEATFAFDPSIDNLTAIIGAITEAGYEAAQK